MYLNRLKRLYEQKVLDSTPAELITINLELSLAFLKNKDFDRARRAVCQLAEALDFRYELSHNLYAIYSVIEKKITAGMVNNDMSAVSDAKDLIQMILERWKDTAQSDSGIGGAQQRPKVIVGLTYDESGLCDYIEGGYSDGFKV